MDYAARSATTSTGTASLKLNRDPLGSPFLNDSAEAVARVRQRVENAEVKEPVGEAGSCRFSRPS